MVLAFAGWPDAAESATGAVRHLVDRLGGTKFAEIDPEEFYVFTDVRPHLRKNLSGERELTWPANDFYRFQAEDPDKSLLLYVGTEPSLRWRAFSDILLHIAEQSQVEMVVSLGALLDEVPHTRDARVSGRASSQELIDKMEWLGVSNSSYEGPVGIHSTFLDACVKKGLSHASLWGHSPHYINNSPNPKVTYALLSRLRTLVDFELDFESLRKKGEEFEAEVAEALVSQNEVEEYVRQLEKDYDATNAPSGDIPSSDVLVEELEDFLRRQQGDES